MYLLYMRKTTDSDNRIENCMHNCLPNNFILKAALLVFEIHPLAMMIPAHSGYHLHRKDSGQYQRESADYKLKVMIN